MTWIWENGEHKFVGGSARTGQHYAKDYASAGHHPGWPKPSLKKLPAPARKAATYPALRQIEGMKLTAREFKFVQMLSCKSRVVFWLYHKLKWPAKEIGDAFGQSILDQHSVYIRNKAIKSAMFAVEKRDKDIDWQEARLLLEEGATEQEIADFYGLGIAAVKRNLR